MNVQELITALQTVADKEKEVICLRSSSELSPTYTVEDVLTDLDSFVILDIRLDISDD